MKAIEPPVPKNVTKCGFDTVPPAHAVSLLLLQRAESRGLVLFLVLENCADARIVKIFDKVCEILTNRGSVD